MQLSNSGSNTWIVSIALKAQALSCMGLLICVTCTESTPKAAPRVLCSVLGHSLQEEHGGAGACPEKGSEAGEGSGEQVC